MGVWRLSTRSVSFLQTRPPSQIFEAVKGDPCRMGRAMKSPQILINAGEAGGKI